MSLAVGFLLAFGALLAVAAAYLVVNMLSRERAALAALADERGWDHRNHGPDDLEPLARRVFPEQESSRSVALLDYLSGPTMVGPFRLNRVRLTLADTHPKHAEATLVHLRTPLACPGLHVEPNASFSTRPAQDNTTPADRFSRLYRYHGKEPGFTHRALDPTTRQFIAAPRRTIRLDWRERDLVIAFPFAARTPRSVEALMAWSTALASHLNEAHSLERGLASIEGTRTPSPTAHVGREANDSQALAG